MIARAQAVKLPIGQIVVLGTGVMALTNPDKFFSLIQKSTQFFLESTNGSSSSASSSLQAPTPIVIHQTGSPPGAGNGRGGSVGFVIQLVVGAGFCWGSYVVMTNVLPEAAKGMLPVTTTAFNNAVTSLGRAVINLKDTVMEQVLQMSKKQEELGEKQDETHEEVLNVKTNVGDLKENLRLVQESLDLCHESLSESERRSEHIARGVELLTRGVSAFLPEDDPLLHDLISFNESSDEKKLKNPAQLNQLQQVLMSLHQSSPSNEATSPGSVPYATLISDNGSSSGPEIELPARAVQAEQCVVEVRALVESVGGTCK